MSQLVDLRSDTVTRPTPAMRAAMAEAPVGDDVFGEDPTVNRLEERVAEMLGKEAALFVPSGTMSNQIGVRLHCGRGDELICEAGCHIFNYEQGAYAQLSSVAARTVETTDGILRLEQLVGLVRPENEHLVRTRLICLENTHNRAGGRILPQDGVIEICRWAHQQGLATHLDGARLFNAAVATGRTARELAEPFDTVSVCFSKGLGAPVGSALAGPRDLMRQAIRERKVFGGGMRQAGIIAAGALYALEHQVERLADDHANARRFAAAIDDLDGLAVRPKVIDTNMVFLDVDPKLGTAAELATRLRTEGLLILAIGAQQLRAVIHLDISADDVDRAAEILRRVATAEPTKSTATAARTTYA